MSSLLCDVIVIFYCVRIWSVAWEWHGLLDIATVTKGGGSLRRVNYSTVVPNLYVFLLLNAITRSVFGLATKQIRVPLTSIVFLVHAMQVKRNWNCLVTNIHPNIKVIEVWNDIGWVNDIIFIGWTIISKSQWPVKCSVACCSQLGQKSRLSGYPLTPLYCKN